MSQNDYSAFADAAPSTEGLASLSNSAIDLYQAELEVAKAEMALKKAQQKVSDLSERVIPDLMEAVGLKELKLKNGTKLTVEPILTVSPLKANRDRVLEWLEKTGHSSKIKRAVTVSLGKDEEQTKLLTSTLADQGFKDTTVDKWIEPQTLKAHVKLLLDDGKEVDMEMLGARQFNRAKITGKADSADTVFEGE